MAKTEQQWKKCRNKCQVPSFGGWDDYMDNNDNDKMSFCSDIFEMERVRDATLLHYGDGGGGDLYGHDIATPAVIVVPCSRRKMADPCVKGVSKKSRWEGGYDYDEPQPPRRRVHRPAPKPVDEDLYKIPPDLLYARSRKKRGWGLFSSCLLPTCAF